MDHPHLPRRNGDRLRQRHSHCAPTDRAAKTAEIDHFDGEDKLLVLNLVHAKNIPSTTYYKRS